MKLCVHSLKDSLFFAALRYDFASEVLLGTFDFREHSPHVDDSVAAVYESREMFLEWREVMR